VCAWFKSGKARFVVCSFTRICVDYVISPGSETNSVPQDLCFGSSSLALAFVLLAEGTNIYLGVVAWFRIYFQPSTIRLVGANLLFPPWNILDDSWSLRALRGRLVPLVSRRQQSLWIGFKSGCRSSPFL
jgi:hypothetical protein